MVAKRPKGQRGSATSTSNNNAANKSNANSGNEDRLEFEGIIMKKYPDNRYDVKVGEQHTVKAYVSGKMKMNSITIAVGDKVRVELTPYDLGKGRIVFRSK